MSRAEELLAQAEGIDLLDLAGAIMANPDRAMVSLAAKVALASALERCWAVCIEADLLVTALEQAMPWAGADPERHEQVALQMAAVRDLMKALKDGAPLPTKQQEKTDGNHA